MILAWIHKSRKFKEDLAVHIRVRDGGVHHDGSEYDHLKRFRKKFNGATTIETNPKYLDAVLELLGMESAHKEQIMTGELESAEVTVYRQCVGGLLYYTQDRADFDAREANPRLCDSLLEGNERLCQQA